MHTVCVGFGAVPSQLSPAEVLVLLSGNRITALCELRIVTEPCVNRPCHWLGLRQRPFSPLYATNRVKNGHTAEYYLQLSLPEEWGVLWKLVEPQRFRVYPPQFAGVGCCGRALVGRGETFD